MTAPASLACPLANGCRVSPGAGAHFGAIAALGGKPHTGLDLLAPIGTRVLAPAPGVVRRTWFDIWGGSQVELQHDGFTTRYAHLSTILLRPGMAVGLGGGFALSGASGNVTGAHLHFEVLADGQYVDPEPLLFGGASSANTQQPPSPGISAYPLDAGKTCAPGYNPGTVNPRIQALPFMLWFNRPTNPDGTVNACVQVGIEPGTNLAVRDATLVSGSIIGALVPIAVNGGIAVLVVVLAFSGAKQALTAGTA